jgi:hypothetical protein
MLTPKVTEISRAGQSWLHPMKLQGILVERPRPRLVVS